MDQRDVFIRRQYSIAEIFFTMTRGWASFYVGKGIFLFEQWCAFPGFRRSMFLPWDFCLVIHLVVAPEVSLLIVEADKPLLGLPAKQKGELLLPSKKKRE